MITEPLISVIIPVYNVEASLHLALDSLLNQTFRDWEAVCVDDGSIDGSGACLDEYAGRDSRIKVIHKENGGVSSARNCGLKLARAPYITMLDADDYFEPSALEQLYLCMKENDCDVVLCTMRKIFSDGRAEIENVYFDAGLHVATPADIYRFAMRSVFCKLYKRDILNRKKIHFPLGIPICEDDVFVVSYWYHVQSFYMLTKSLYNYVQSESSVLKKLGEGRLPIESYMATLEVPTKIYHYILSQRPQTDMLRVWCRLLLKAQCNIDLWMLECAKNNEYVPKLREKIKQMRAIIKKQISFWEYSYIVGYTYLKRFVRKVIKKLF